VTSQRVAITIAVVVCFATAGRVFAAFGVTSSGGNYVVDTGAGLVFRVSQSSGDINSIQYNGVEYQSTSKNSHIASGLGSSTTVTATNINNQYVKVTIQTSPSNTVVSSLTHYLIVTNGLNTIFMATYTTAEPAVGELRWITRLQSSKIGNGPIPSDTRGNTGAIESSDVVGMADGTTRSKYYGDAATRGKDRAMDLTYCGATGSGIGVWMIFGNRESSSGGPFFRDIENQCGSDQEIYNYMNSGHNQTEAYRVNGVLHGPYALVFTSGGLPAYPMDFSWMDNAPLNLSGYVPRASRGAVKGTVTGIPAGFQAVVGFANSNAQYWATVASNGNYVTPPMKTGAYNVVLYKGELSVAASNVTVTAGLTNTLDLVSAEYNPVSIWRIGEWDGTPNGFMNATNILALALPNFITMHPSDVRMTPWFPKTFTVGADPVSSFPAIQMRATNSPTTIKFILNAGQIATYTLRIGATCAYNNGRPQVTINGNDRGFPGASSQPSSRSFTIGTYRGNNVTWTYSIPSGTLVVGTNTLTINPVSGSSDLGPFLSAGWVYDALDLIIPNSTNNAAPPAAPSGLTATAVSAGQINLAWTDNATNETNFLIERAPDATNFVQIAALAADTTNYSDTGLAPLTTYYYRLRASNAGGVSSYSNTNNATTPPASASLTWRGDGITNIWDLGVTSNWWNGAAQTVFADGAQVVFDDTGSNAPNVNLTGTLQPATVTVSATKNYTFAGSGALAGAMTLTKDNAGALTLSSSNAFTGGVLANAGTLTIANANAAGTGSVTLNGATMNNNASIANAIHVSDTSTLNTGFSQLSGAWSGAGALNVFISGGNTFTVTGSMTNFSGSFLLGNSTGFFRFNNSVNLSFGSPLAAFDLGTATATLLNRNGSITIQLGALFGGPGTTLSGRSSGTGGSGSTYVIGGNDSSSEFNGAIKNGGDVVSIIKRGAGTLRLNGANTYTGATTVSNGALLVNGSLGTSTVTVVSGASFGGAGNCVGPVTVNAGGILAPGDDVGTLTIQSNLVAGSGAVFVFDLGANSDLVAVGQNLTVGGTLHIADAGGFGAGSYPLFTYAGTLTYNGLTVGAAPFGFHYSVSTNTPGQINLVVTSALTPFQQWQFQYFGCTNCPDAAADADADGDGMSNTNEFLAGTDPTNSVSALQIISVAAQGNDIHVAWRTAAGRTNAVQAGAEPLGTNFTDLSGPVVITGGDTTNYIHTGGATNAPVWFYRVRLVP
jgi:rhamnogalacturonan endolyase